MQAIARKLVETFSSLYPDVDLNSNEIKLEKASNEIFRAIISILGLNKHLGVVVLEYVPPAYSPQLAALGKPVSNKSFNCKH